MAGYIGTQPVPQSTQHRESFTATASQTSFATAGYTAGFVDVYLNGVHLLNGTDYTATNGSDIVLTTGAAAGDVLEVISYSTFEVNSQNFTGDTTVANLDVTGTFTAANLTLSGGVYLGGTGAANKLDDYEEGTWTPASNNIGTLSIQRAQYTKIGRQVHLFAQFTGSSTTTVTLDNNIVISGLPFAPDSDTPRGLGGILQFYGSHGGSKNALADILISAGSFDCEIIVVRGSFTYADCISITVNVTYNTTA